MIGITTNCNVPVNNRSTRTHAIEINCETNAPILWDMGDVNVYCYKCQVGLAILELPRYCHYDYTCTHGVHKIEITQCQ